MKIYSKIGFKKEMFYLMMHLTHFIYGYMASKKKGLMTTIHHTEWIRVG